jgi:hypothetical protein
VCEALKPEFQFRNTTPSSGIATSRQQHYQQGNFRGDQYVQIEVNSTDTPPLNNDICPQHGLEVPSGPSLSLERVSLPSLLNSELLTHLNRAEKEQLYITHWEGSCIGALGEIFLTITKLIGVHQPLKHALLALLACNLSRSRPEQSTIQQQRLLYSPKRDHLIAFQQYYSSAVGQIARYPETKSSSSTSLTLATLVFFCYMESAMGNFQAFAYHSKGISDFIHLNLLQLASDALGPKLISAWLQAKYQNWWLRLYF